jgi:hypothetical protein
LKQPCIPMAYGTKRTPDTAATLFETLLTTHVDSPPLGNSFLPLFWNYQYFSFPHWFLPESTEFPEFWPESMEFPEFRLESTESAGITRNSAIPGESGGESGGESTFN